MSDNIVIDNTVNTVVVSDTEITVIDVGVTGPQGPQGPQGIQGVAGANGSDLDWTTDQGSTNIHSGNYINTTYSVGDGGLTQNNFTDTIKAKLDGVEAGATADQTASEIKTAYESNADTNAFTDADHSKLDGIEANATADQTAAEIEAIVNHDNLQGFSSNEHIDWTADQGSTNIHSGNYINTTYTEGDGGLTEKNFTTALKTKLDGIEANATADQTDAEIRAAVEAATDSNVFTDADHTKLAGIDTGANNYTLPAATSSTLGGVKQGTNITISADGTISSTASGGSGSSSLTVQDEGSSLSTAATTLNFTGNGVVASGTGATKTINVTDTDTTYTDATTSASGLMSASDKTKLDGVEANATADQTDAEIRAAVEAASDSNVFTDADHSKLNAIEASADVTDTANVVAALTAGTNVSIANDGTISATDTNTTYTSSDFNHDDLTGFVANEHIDWTVDQGATNIHAGNYTDTTYTDATTSASGLMSASDKTKLDGVAASATANPNALDNISEDTSPQLGGNLDVNGKDIVTTSNGDIDLDPNGSGKVVFKGNSTKGSGQFVLNCENNSHGITIKGPPHSAGASYTLTLPNTDGNASDYLQTDGSGNLTWAAVSGGGGGDPDLYRDNASSATTPSATGTNAVAIGTDSVSSGTSSMAIGQNTNAANTRAVVLGGYSQAYAINSAAIGFSATVNSNATDSSALGTRAQVGSNATGATAIGKSYASGNYSFAAAIENNGSSYGATGTNSVAIGKSAKAQGTESTALGPTTQAQNSYSVAIGYQANSSNDYGVAIGRQAAASGATSTVLGGYACTASGSYSTSVGGRSNVADGYGSRTGGYGASARGIRGKDAFASQRFSTSGDAQTATIVLKSDTTDATAEALTTNNSAASTDNQVVLPNNSVYGFTGTVIARENSAQTNDFAVWEIKGGAVRAGSASTTALGSYNINKISESTGAANWSIGLSADTTNGAVAITVTGEASHSIRWVATVNTTEVTY